MNKIAQLPRPVKIGLWIALAVFAYVLPLLELPVISTQGTDFGFVLFLFTVYGLIAVGLNIVIGYAGLLDLGYVGFYAIGAYTAAILTSFHASWPLLLAVPAAVATTTLAGLLLGWPTLRVRGDYLAIVTLGFGEIIRLTAVNLEWLGDFRGISNIAKPPSVELFEVPHLFWGNGTVLLDTRDTTTFLEFSVVDSTPYYWLGLTLLIIALFADRLVKDSRVGRAWEATREDEDAAEIMGVPTFRFKLLAFATGAFIGGLAGALFATQNGFINPAVFPLLTSILFVAAVVVGGQGNRWGVLVGAFLIAYLPERFQAFEEWRFLVFGLALVVLANFRPEGLIPPKRTVRARRMEARIEQLEEGDGEGRTARV
ncbi:branched-chain amino acid ABC transporter permease [Nocardioides sp. SYSU DS0651]|uniref:branched-chain amino acid ABC transporter permease n=1 Tax=Nocardioides sp. SYSU DS0651 TaxID=3415955 RepID=UPI003F4B4C58